MLHLSINEVGHQCNSWNMGKFELTSKADSSSKMETSSTSKIGTFGIPKSSDQTPVFCLFLDLV